MLLEVVSVVHGVGVGLLLLSLWRLRFSDASSRINFMFGGALATATLSLFAWHVAGMAK